MPKNKKDLEPVLLEDITKYIIPASLQYSPDGKLLAFHALRSDVEKNCYKKDVYLIKDGKTVQMTYSVDAGFLFFDDNATMILSRKAEDEKPFTTTLFKLNVNGGEAKPWITLPFPLRQMKKVTEGVYAAVGMIDANDPDFYQDADEVRKEKTEKKEKDKDYTVVDEVPYWFNGAGFTNKMRSALFIVDVREGFNVKRITAPKFSVSSFVCEGTTVYYAGNVLERSETMYEKLYAYDIETKKVTTIFGKDVYSFGKLFVIDGQLFAEASDMKKYGCNETKNICKIFKNKVETVYVPEVTLYTSVAGDTVHGGGEGFYCDGKSFITLATVEDHNALYSFDKDMNRTVVWEKPGMAAFIAVSDKKIAMCYQDWNHVAEIYEMDREGNHFKKITSLNDKALEGKYIAKPKALKYTSHGEALKGWVLLPDNFDKEKKYPAVFDIHGGPRTVYGETFFHEMQLWAAKGYIVFFTNIRGSDGRGDAFADIRDQYGYVDYDNLMDFTDAVLKKYPCIDEARICETGGSYGGFMTNWIITHTDRFCCAASQRSISNWISMSFISDIGNFFGPDQCGGNGLFGQENTEKLWDHSPLKYAENCKTPTLFIHSDEDYRCPLPEGMQMMQALAVRNIETRMVIFHGENHELSRSGKPQHRLRRLQEITDWFEAHAKA